MERLPPNIVTPLLPNHGAQLLCPGHGLGLQSFFNSLGQSFGCQVLIRDRSWSGPSFGNHSTPERLVPEEGDDDSRPSSLDSRRTGSRSTVMYDCRDALEQPIVWAVSQHKDVLGNANRIGAEATPALRYQSSHARHGDGIKNGTGKQVRVVDNNRAETNVNGWRPSAQERCKIRVGCIRRR